MLTGFPEQGRRPRPREESETHGGWALKGTPESITKEVAGLLLAAGNFPAAGHCFDASEGFWGRIRCHERCETVEFVILLLALMVGRAIGAEPRRSKTG